MSSLLYVIGNYVVKFLLYKKCSARMQLEHVEQLENMGQRMWQCEQ